MEYDIEAYLEGNLSDGDRAAFEAALLADPSLREEVDLQRQIRQHLQGQLLREQVTGALEEKDGTSGQPNWLPLLGLALLILMGNYFFNSPKNNASKSPAATPPPPALPAESDRPSAPPTAPIPESPPTSPPKAPTPPKEKTVEQAIAQNDPPQNLAAPLYPGPNVRGAQADDAAWKALIDALWYTHFPPATLVFQPPYQAPAQLLAARNFTSAYVSLQRLERNATNNDTLRYLKGYCLLEMGEGTEAIRYFDQLEKALPQQQEQLAWYQGLAFLIGGKRNEALLIFEKIAAQQGHVYQLQSKKALDLLR